MVKKRVKREWKRVDEEAMNKAFQNRVSLSPMFKFILSLTQSNRNQLLFKEHR